MMEDSEHLQSPQHSYLFSCTRYVSQTITADKKVMLQNQFIATHVVAKKQKLCRASNELNIPAAKARQVVIDDIVIAGPAWERASCTRL